MRWDEAERAAEESTRVVVLEEADDGWAVAARGRIERRAYDGNADPSGDLEVEGQAPSEALWLVPDEGEPEQLTSVGPWLEHEANGWAEESPRPA